jgi:hypothetical protein
MRKKPIITGIATIIIIGTSISGNALSFDSTIQKQIPDKHLKNEIGLNVVSLMNKDYYDLTNDKWLRSYYYFGTLRPIAQMNLGLVYKSDKGKYVQRMALMIINERFEYINRNLRDYYYESKGQSSGFELRYGHEKLFSKKKLQPYGSIDLIAGYRVQKIEGYEHSGWGGGIGFLNSEYRMKEIGLAPGLGVKYKFSERFSISLETNLRISYFHFKEKDSENDTRIYGMFRKPIRMFVDPLRFITLNYHF